jgi:hypothetical protein
MKHLLLARFQGALLGGNSIYLNPHQTQPNPLVTENLPALLGGIDSLIRCQGFNREDWLQSSYPSIAQPTQAIVTMLPLMLFFHDDRGRLAEVVTELGESWQLDRVTITGTLAIGYLLAAAITENLQPNQIIPELSTALPEIDPLVSEQLSIIPALLDRYASLHQVRAVFTPIAHPIATPIALASYCFLSAPEDFNLAVRRAHHINYQNHLTCALTGILAGAHNSFTGMPIGAYLATQGREQILPRSAKLLAVWSGSYQSDYNLPLDMSALAAPSVIQRRS